MQRRGVLRRAPPRVRLVVPTAAVGLAFSFIFFLFLFYNTTSDVYDDFEDYAEPVEFDGMASDNIELAKEFNPPQPKSRLTDTPTSAAASAASAASLLITRQRSGGSSQAPTAAAAVDAQQASAAPPTAAPTQPEPDYNNPPWPRHRVDEAGAFVGIHPLLQPGPLARDAFGTFLSYLAATTVKSLQSMSKDEFCSLKFTRIKMPQRNWGSALNEVVNAFHFSVLTNRVTVLSSESDAVNIKALPLQPRYGRQFATETLVRTMLGKRCPDVDAQTLAVRELNFERPSPPEGGMGDVCLDPANITERFVDIRPMKAPCMRGVLQVNPNYKTLYKDQFASVRQLLEHQAFAGIVVLGAFKPADFIMNILAERVPLLTEKVKTHQVERDAYLLKTFGNATRFQRRTRPSDHFVDLAVHMRHITVDYETTTGDCVAARERRIAELSGAQLGTIKRYGFLAADWPDTIPKLYKAMHDGMRTVRDNVEIHLDMFNYTEMIAANPKLHQIFLKSTPDVFGQPGSTSTDAEQHRWEGWTGPYPASFALLDLLMLGIVRANSFIGSARSAFSEIAIGLFLATTPWDYRVVAMRDPRIFVGCDILWPDSYGRYGMTGSLPSAFQSEQCVQPTAAMPTAIFSVDSAVAGAAAAAGAGVAGANPQVAVEIARAEKTLLDEDGQPIAPAAPATDDEEAAAAAAPANGAAAVAPAVEGEPGPVEGEPGPVQADADAQGDPLAGGEAANADGNAAAAAAETEETAQLQ